MEKDGKEDLILIRIQKNRKDSWKKICKERNITLTNLIIASVENRILEDERKKILRFIEKQDNIFIKIETNINQIARVANTQKFISSKELSHFQSQLKTIIKLKEQQNEIFIKIYALMADDR
ncbi:MAG: plasmid mobilization relaxosome protein MobC [Cloacibacterium sp.]|uniref:plasmid mobilization relaxosome protein MobC n=1 Tax=Cloacibacterium sp. TaxID=1913682 RepID=UPI003C74A474